MLWAMVFISGGVLMALEIIGSRILAPWFGSSIFVWGSLISVFLGALSLGYSLGGVASDRWPRSENLALCLAVPALLIFLLPFYWGTVNDALIGQNLGPRWGPLLASLCLFFPPSLFLGMISPYAIKLAATTLSRVGNTAGQLYAVSTLGSIAGTLGTAFFLIAWFGTRAIVHGLGVILFLLAAAVLVHAVVTRPHAPARQAEAPPGGRPPKAHPSDSAERSANRSGGARRNRKRTPPIPPGRLRTFFPWVLGALLPVTAAAVGQGGAQAAQTLHQKDTFYHHIRVIQEGDLRYLRFDTSWQSGMDVKNPIRLIFQYTDYFHLGPALRPQTQKALMIGLGGGSVPKNFLVNYPSLAMDVVEIDPEVVQVAQNYFELAPDPRLTITAQDGRVYIRNHPGPYGLIYLDAYYADAIPFHLTTVEFLRQVKSRLEPDGLVVSNIIGSLAGPGSRLFRSMLKTFQSVFPQVYVFAVGWAEGNRVERVERNVILIASQSAERLSAAEIARRAAAQEAKLRVPSPIARASRSFLDRAFPADDVNVLTDDYAPVDSLLHVYF